MRPRVSYEALATRWGCFATLLLRRKKLGGFLRRLSCCHAGAAPGQPLEERLTGPAKAETGFKRLVCAVSDPRYPLEQRHSRRLAARSQLAHCQMQPSIYRLDVRDKNRLHVPR